MAPGVPPRPSPSPTAVAPNRLRPLVALALLAPTIPELLTGSTPITTLFFDPAFFLLQLAGLVALYGGGAILIREFVVTFRKGWGSVLLLGAAYGIGEEGFAVHTFFEPSGAPVHAFASYGQAFGVDWLWVLGLVVFHATYSIALPILLVGLWFPAQREERWLARPGLALVATAYLLIVTLFALVVPYGPTPVEFAFFLAVALLLIAGAYWAPRDLLRPRPGPRRLPAWGIALAGSVPYDLWTFLLFQSGHPILPAVGGAALLAGGGLLALLAVRVGAGSKDPEWTKFYLACGMLGVLFAWDVLLEFFFPGILLVTAVFLYLLYHLRRLLRQRALAPPSGAHPGPLGTA